MRIYAFILFLKIKVIFTVELEIINFDEYNKNYIYILHIIRVITTLIQFTREKCRF